MRIINKAQGGEAENRSAAVCGASAAAGTAVIASFRFPKPFAVTPRSVRRVFGACVSVMKNKG